MDANREQAEAIGHTEGALLVTAGPGTGKTFVIEQKVTHLAVDEGVRPNRICCLTFTEKAAGELRERVGGALAGAKVAGEVQAATFHGFCRGLLAEFAGRAGLPPQFHLLNGAPLEYLVLQRLEEFPIERSELLDGGIAFVKELAWLRQRCLQERITAKQAVATARARLEAVDGADEQALWGEALDLARGLEVVEGILADAAVVTYEDLIDRALRLVEDDPVVRRALADRYDHLLVDEFQDNNFAQAQLVHALAGLGLTVTVVGDEDQSIYKFRGAYERTLKDFLERFGQDAGRVDLVQNYRSTPPVLEAAETLVRHAADRLDKAQLTAARDDLPDEAGPVRVVVAEYPEDEARAIAREIERLHDAEGIAFGDMAVLYRGGNVPTMRALPQALDELGIPQELSAASDLFQRPEVKDLVSWLFVLRDPGTPGPALHRVLTSPEVALPLIDEPAVTHAVRYGKGGRRGLGALRGDELTEELTYRGRDAVGSLLHLTDHLVEARRSAQPAAYVGRVLRETGLLARTTGERAGPPRAAGLGGARSLVRVVQLAREWERAHPLSTVDDFVEYLHFLVQRGSDVDEEVDLGPDEDAVQVMTVHKAKGKEFPVVFVVGLNKDQFPARSREPRISERLVAANQGRDQPPGVDIEEERRLLFVAMTRARDHLYLTRHHRTTATSRGVKRPSPFLAELGLPEDPDESLDELPAYLAYERLTDETDEDERPLALDQGLWLANRAAAHVHALARRAGRGDPEQASAEQLRDDLRRVVETAIQAYAYAHPDAELGGTVEELATVLGDIDPKHLTHDEAVAETVAARTPEASFSYSAFRAYTDCPKQYYYRYLLGVPEPPSRALERGTLVHRVLERFTTEHGTKGAWEDVLALLDEELAHKVGHAHQKEADDVREEAVGYLEAYWEGRDGFEGEAELVEESLAVEFEDFRLRAKVDRVDRLSDGRVELVDYKTGNAKSANKYANEDLQIPLYALAWKVHTGELPAQATVWSLKQGRVVRLGVGSGRELDDEKLADAYGRAKAIVEAIGDGEFTASPGYHCRFCPFNFICGDAQG